MPGNRGVSSWHKKIHSKPKHAPPSLKLDSDELTATSDDSSDFRRYHSWRPMLHGSRPATPVSVVPTTPTTEDRSDYSETDIRNDYSEASTPHRSSRPKAARYTSKYNHFKEVSKVPEFSEPWSEDAPPSYQLVIDPANALQSVYSHMLNNSSEPIPQEYYSGLFRIFEDYRKLKSENEQLKSILDDTCRNWEAAEKQWAESECQHEVDIHRLEALVARGESSMAGRVRDERKSLLGFQRRHRKTISTDKLPPTMESFSREHMDGQFRLTVQQARLHRPSSPSRQMTALSQHFMGTGSTHLPVGAPPSINRGTTLLRKVQSELNLAVINRVESSQPVSDSVDASFSDTGEPLPDEATTRETTLMGFVAECEAFVELRELGKLVALRRGLKVHDFVDGLIRLFSDTDVQESNEGSDEQSSKEQRLQLTLSKDAVHQKFDIEEAFTSKPSLRTLQSQHRLNSCQERRRQFSFEFDEGHLQALDEKLIQHDEDQDLNDSSDSDSQISVDSRIPRLWSQLGQLNRSPQTSSSDLQKPTKIPSPAQTIGRVRVRQKNSESSLQSVFARPNQDLRRDSRSSIMTAFRESPSGKFQPIKSRNNSIRNLSMSESPLASKDQVDKRRTRNSVVLKTAGGYVDQPSPCGGSSLTKSDTKPSRVSSPACVSRSTGLLESENDGSHKQ